jgi:hypothetical protein
VDLDSLIQDPDTDSDPTFQMNPDFDDQKLKKNTAKFFISFFDQNLQFSYP